MAPLSQPASISPVDMSPWVGRIDPEPDSLRWHQVIQPLEQAGKIFPECPAGIALLGFACDAGVARNQGRVGAAAGPRAIRQALAPMAWHCDLPAYDAGDVVCQPRNDDDGMEHAQQQLAERIAVLLGEGHRPVVLGGGHEIAFASWSGLARHLEAMYGPTRAGSETSAPPSIGIINLDAHLDLRDPSHVRSSGTPFAQIAEACRQRGWPFRYACLGVSQAANTRALFRRAHELGVLVRRDHEMSAANISRVQRDLERFMARCEHLYLTIDLDVLPSSEAPGVSAPAARGVSLEHLEPLIEAVRATGKLRLTDIAELNPGFDLDNRTARAAARLIHQLTLAG